MTLAENRFPMTNTLDGLMARLDIHASVRSATPPLVAANGATVGQAIAPSVLALAALLLWAASAQSASAAHQATLSSLSLTAAAWTGAIVITDQRVPHQSELRLGPWLMSYAGISFGLASITAWLAPETVSSELQLDTIRQAHALVLLGFAGFVLGYLFTPRAGLHQLLSGGLSRVHNWDTNQRLSLRAAVLTYLLGLGALLLGAMLSGSYGYLGDTVVMTADDVSWYTAPIQILSTLRGFAILALWVAALQQPRRVLSVSALIITTIDLLAGLLTGMKEAPIATLMAVVLAYVFVKRRLPLIALAVVGSWFTFFLYPLVTSLRIVVRGNQALTLGEALPAMISGLSRTQLDTGSNFWSAASRFRLIDNLAIIIQKTPSEIPFQSVWDLGILVLSGFIPRAIWPTKPVRQEGLLFYHEFYGGTSYSSSAITIPGSLYLYGGAVVLVAGMLLFGMLTRSLDDGMRATKSRTGVLLMLALLPPFIKMEASAPTLLASLPALGVGWLLASRLLYHPVRHDHVAGRSLRGHRAMEAQHRSSQFRK